MTETRAEPQESRTAMVGIRVTPGEKRAIELVAEVRQTEGGVSQLLRERSFAEVIDEGLRILDRVREQVASSDEAA